MGIEIRLFLAIDAFSRFSGMPLACSADLSHQLAKQLLDSTAAASGCDRGPMWAGVTVGSWRRFSNPRLTPRSKRFIVPANNYSLQIKPMVPN
ncbi:MAG: hypothetical protein ACREV7_22940 [Steroidobacteraceae bacterium]